MRREERRERGRGGKSEGDRGLRREVDGGINRMEKGRRENGRHMRERRKRKGVDKWKERGE